MSEAENHSDEISALADQIYAFAAPLDKPERHRISDAAKLIRWLIFDQQTPGDTEALAAIVKLRESVRAHRGW